MLFMPVDPLLVAIGYVCLASAFCPLVVLLVAVGVRWSFALPGARNTERP